MKEQDIISAAKNEFLMNGFKAAGMNQIARSASVSKRTLYKKFSSKEEIYNAVVNQLFDSEHFNLVYSYPQSLSFEEMLDDVIDRHIKYLTDPHVIELGRIVIGEQITNESFSEDTFQKLLSFRGLFNEWLENCVTRGIYKNTLPLESTCDFFHRSLMGALFIPLVIRSRTEFSQIELTNIKLIAKRIF